MTPVERPEQLVPDPPIPPHVPGTGPPGGSVGWATPVVILHCWCDNLTYITEGQIPQVLALASVEALEVALATARERERAR